MKKHLITITFLMICMTLFSQNNIVIEGKTKFNLEYYFDTNSNQKEVALMNEDGTYSILIPNKSKYEKITIHKQGNDDCEQVLQLNNLINFCKINKLEKIRNDATYISTCLKMDAMASSEFEKYTGGWVNEKYKMYFYTDQEFFLKYKENNYGYKRVGIAKIVSDNTIALKSWYIINEFTNTLIDDNRSIIFQLNENGDLESIDLDSELKKSNFDPYE